MWRWPTAVADSDGRVVLVGEARRVIPAGVLWRHRDEGEGPRPLRLRADSRQVVDDLFVAAESYSRLMHRSNVEPAEASRKLVEHVQRFGAPDLCRHGLPRFHSESLIREPPEWQAPDESAAWYVARTDEERAAGGCVHGDLDVLSVVGFAESAMLCIDIYETARRRRAWVADHETVASLVDDVTTLEPALRRLVVAEADRSGSLAPARARQVADLWLSGMLAASGVRPEMATRSGVGPGLVLASPTVTGLYLLEVARRAAGDPVTATRRSCPGCGLEVSGPPDKVWCDSPECGRLRQRRRQAASRSRRRATTGEQ